MKPWRDEIEQHIRNWSNRLGNLGWWPRFVYHFTDVQNAARIITDGVLYCRSEVEELGRMAVDNASPDIIAHTKKKHKNFVRLYFRPKTPTQFNNEGIRPRADRKLGSHCPVPVYFCFDALELLARDGVEFSNGNMASHWVEHSDNRDFFFSIPFQNVFHHGSFPPEEKQEIVFRRNAEVLVPRRLELTPLLKFIACRSEAERQTLLHLLPWSSSMKWGDKVRLGEQGFFERRWTHVEEVVVINPDITFRFNPNTKQPGPFEVKIEYCEQNNQPPVTFSKTIAKLNQAYIVRFPNAKWGEIKLFLDDALAFSDMIFFEELPF
jgi:hypothetical protein